MNIFEEKKNSEENDKIFYNLIYSNRPFNILKDFEKMIMESLFLKKKIERELEIKNYLIISRNCPFFNKKYNDVEKNLKFHKRYYLKFYSPFYYLKGKNCPTIEVLRNILRINELN